jgi:hypothetical protein
MMVRLFRRISRCCTPRLAWSVTIVLCLVVGFAIGRNWDRLPASGDAKNWAEALGIVGGGIWALYVFVYECRAHRHSLDGDLAIETNDLSKELVAVSVRAVWNNRGKFPISFDSKKYNVAVYAVSAPQGGAGNLPYKSDLGEPLHKQDRGTNSGFVLEPNSSSVLRAHFVLPRGPVYRFVWDLTESKDGDHWRKDIIWSSVPTKP